jgi:uncharacterized RDD family membrane protein YckC
MSSGFASVRCIRCGAYTQGAQVCGDCTERQRADEAARAERVTQAIAERPANAASASPSAGACPSCGRLAGPGAIFCGFCRYQFRALAPGEGELAYAGFWIRFVAYLIDGIILGFMNIVVASLIADPFTVIFVQFVLNATYVIGFWIGQGATPGKMAVGVKIVMANGQPIEFGAACLRYVGYIACALTLGIGYLMIAFTAEKRGLQDYIGGTVVIKTR